MQARLKELANTYPKSFFFIMSCKVMNIVSNNVHIGPFINLLASSGGLYGKFGLSLDIISLQTKIFQSTNWILASVHVMKKDYHMLSCPVKFNRVSKSIISVFLNSYAWDKTSWSSQKSNQSCSRSRYTLLLYMLLSSRFVYEINRYLLIALLLYYILIFTFSVCKSTVARSMVSDFCWICPLNMFYTTGMIH